MRVRTFCFSLVCALGASTYLLWRGWLQLSLTAGSYGVMRSRSGGYHHALIAPGRFLWRWEPLLPSNAELFAFELKKQTVSVTVQDVLPAAKEYAQLLDQHAPFDWTLALSARVALKEAFLLDTVQRERITDQNSLERYVDTTAQAALTQVSHDFIARCMADPALYERVHTQYGLATRELKRAIEKEIPHCAISEVVLSEVHIPDMVLYHTAEQAYRAFEAKRSEHLSALAQQAAKRSALENFEMQRLTKWGEFFQRYPSVIDFLNAIRQDGASTLETLKKGSTASHRAIPHEETTR